MAQKGSVVVVSSHIWKDIEQILTTIIAQPTLKLITSMVACGMCGATSQKKEHLGHMPECPYLVAQRVEKKLMEEIAASQDQA